MVDLGIDSLKGLTEAGSSDAAEALQRARVARPERLPEEGRPAHETEEAAAQSADGADEPARAVGEAPVITEGALQEQVDTVNETLARVARNAVRFQMDTEHGELVVQVVDPETQEVIRQLPPEALSDLRERFQETVGLLFDESR